MKTPTFSYMTFKREQNKKPAIERRAGFQILGWLMGLEPTTTGITILTFYYLPVLIDVHIINTNQQLKTFQSKSDGPEC